MGNQSTLGAAEPGVVSAALEGAAQARKQCGKYLEETVFKDRGAWHIEECIKYGAINRSTNFNNPIKFSG